MKLEISIDDIKNMLEAKGFKPTNDEPWFEYQQTHFDEESKEMSYTIEIGECNCFFRINIKLEDEK
tara:strand:+ start:1440 stop:1637 length:198 start_codon:yes stop_codon:yes gene_type:complete